MSLRTDIHSAFDEIAPSVPGLRERVVQTVIDRNAATGRYGALSRFRMPLSLVAVILLVALVVGALIGGRLAGDWRSFINPTQPAHIDPAQLHELEHRALKFPPHVPGGHCDTGPWDSTQAHLSYGWLGQGPVYQVIPGGPYITTSWGTYIYLQFQTDASLSGPVLIRAMALDAGQDVIFIGEHAAGRTAVTDLVNGESVQQYSEAVLDTSNPASRAAGGLVQWSVVGGIAGYQAYPTPGNTKSRNPPNPALICVGWQIDGLNFTERFVSD